MTCCASFCFEAARFGGLDVPFFCAAHWAALAADGEFVEDKFADAPLLLPSAERAPSANLSSTASPSAVCCAPACAAPAAYAERAPPLRPYCAAHRRPGQPRLAQVACREPGCAAFAEFGAPGATAGERFCAAHKRPGHVEAKAWADLCCAPGCFTRASFGVDAARRCAAHREAGDVNVLALRLRCSAPGCVARAAFGRAGGRALFCAAHRGARHVRAPRALGRYCRAPGCAVRASFGAAGGRALYCGAHRQAGHVGVEAASRCRTPGCAKYASFGARGRLVACAAHRAPEHVRVYGPSAGRSAGERRRPRPR